MIRKLLVAAAFALLPLTAAAPAMAGTTPTVPPCQSGQNLTAHPTCPTTPPCPEVKGSPTTHPTCQPNPCDLPKDLKPVPSCPSTTTTPPCHGPLDVSTVKACCPPDAAATAHECPPPCPVDVKSQTWPHPSPSCPSTTPSTKPSTTPSSSPSTSASTPATTPSSPSGTVSGSPKPSGSSPAVVVTPGGPVLAHTGASETVPLTAAAVLLVSLGTIAIVGGAKLRRRAGTHR